MRKIISLILIISSVISLSACGQSKNSLITAVGNTCFDDYYEQQDLFTPNSSFSGMTLNEILNEHSNKSNFSWSVNRNIPFFKNFSDQYDNAQVDLVCLTLNSKNTNSKSNTVFSVNKNSQMVMPLGWISADRKLNTQPNNAIVHMYMLIDDEQKEIDTSKSMPISDVETVTINETLSKPLSESIIGKWELNNGGVWEYDKNGKCWIDFSNYDITDTSLEAQTLRKQKPVSFDYTVDGDYLVFKMGAANYRNYTRIENNIKYETDSISGETTTMRRIEN